MNYKHRITEESPPTFNPLFVACRVSMYRIGSPDLSPSGTGYGSNYEIARANALEKLAFSLVEQIP